MNTKNLAPLCVNLYFYVSVGAVCVLHLLRTSEPQQIQVFSPGQSSASQSQRGRPQKVTLSGTSDPSLCTAAGTLSVTGFRRVVPQLNTHVQDVRPDLILDQVSQLQSDQCALRPELILDQVNTLTSLSA